MIVIGGFGIVDAPSPAWWPDEKAARERRFADLDEKIREMQRVVRENSGPRRHPAATRPAGSSARSGSASPHIDTVAIYAERNRPRADLCDGVACWAKRIGAKAPPLGQPRPPVRPERGRTLPRSRSIAAISGDYWASRAGGGAGQVIATSPRGGR
jgi:hypothetical protein